MKKHYVVGAVLILCSALFLFRNFEYQNTMAPLSDKDIATQRQDTRQPNSLLPQQILTNENPPTTQIESCLSLYRKHTQSYREKEHLFNQLNTEWTQANIPFWQRQRAAIALGFSPNEARSMMWTNIQYIHNINTFRLFSDPKKILAAMIMYLVVRNHLQGVLTPTSTI